MSAGPFPEVELPAGALVIGGVLPEFVIPTWVILLCAGVMALGTSVGGWKIMKTLGMRLTHLKTHQGFAAEMAAASTIEQAVIRTPREDWAKRDVLRHLIRTQNITNGIVFCNRKTDVATLHRSLVKHGFSAGCLHGDMSQPDRLKTLEAFRGGSLQILVASDVAARGLDIPTVSHVFNFEAPVNAEDYIHRIGRTGRAGRAGHAFMLVSGEDDRRLGAIAKLTGTAIAEITLEGYDFPAPQEGASGRPERKSGRDRFAKGGRGERRPRHIAAVADEALAAPVEQPRMAKPRPQRPAAAAPARTEASDRRKPLHRVEDASDKPVLGMGDHVPAFMMRPPARPRRPASEAA